MTDNSLAIWTVYDHPRDFPGDFVARRFVVDAGGARPTDDILTAKSIDVLRDLLEARGLVKLDRSPGDDPKIVESWL